MQHAPSATGTEIQPGVFRYLQVQKFFIIFQSFGSILTLSTVLRLIPKFLPKFQVGSLKLEVSRSLILFQGSKVPKVRFCNCSPA